MTIQMMDQAERSWGGQLRQMRRSLKLSQGGFVDALTLLQANLSDVEVTLLQNAGIDLFAPISNQEISRWENDHRLPAFRRRHLFLIWGLVKLGALTDPIDAEQWLAQVDGQGKLTEQEYRAIFGQTAFERLLANVPALRTPLVARERELADLVTAIRSGNLRLLTLTGAGGVGKTVLALAVAHQLTADFGDGICFVELAESQHGWEVVPTLAQALGLTDDGSQPLLQRLCHWLHSRHLLLVLDNFEHLLEAALVVSALIDGCPLLTILVTSRVRLDLHGEHEYLLSPLPVPPTPSTDDFSTESLVAYGAIDLFYRRATAANRVFSITPQNRAAIVAICQRLDGLPLAIELAAAKLKYLSPQAILQQLNAVDTQPALYLLRTQNRDVSSRHRSLWDAISWSYSQLSETEQKLWRTVALFVGTWTAEAAAALLPDAQSVAILTRLIDLVDQNLLYLHDRGGVESGVAVIAQAKYVPGDAQKSHREESKPRFGMLETLREFGQEQLRLHGEEDTAQLARVHHYLALAEEAEPQLATRFQDRWLALLDREHANLRAALLWTIQSNREALGMRLGAAMCRYWMRRNLRQEALELSQRLLAIVPETENSEAYAQILFFVGLFCDHTPLYDRRVAYMRQCMELCRRMGYKRRLSFALGLLTNDTYNKGNYVEANQLQLENLALMGELDDQWQLHIEYGHRGRQLAGRGQLDEGDRLCRQGLAGLRKIGDKFPLCVTLNGASQIAFLRNEYDRALTHAEEALTLAQELDNSSLVVAALQQMGRILAIQGQHKPAQQMLERALLALHGIDNSSSCLAVIDSCITFAAVTGKTQLAVRLMAAAQSLRRQDKVVLPPLWQLEQDRLLDLLRTQLSATELKALWSQGEAMEISEIVTDLFAVVAY